MFKISDLAFDHDGSFILLKKDENFDPGEAAMKNFGNAACWCDFYEQF